MAILTMSIKMDPVDNMGVYTSGNVVYPDVSYSVSVQGYGDRSELFRAFYIFMRALGYSVPELEEFIE